MQETSVVALLPCARIKKVCAEDILESADNWILSQEWQEEQRPRRRLGKTPADEYKPAYYEQGARLELKPLLPPVPFGGAAWHLCRRMNTDTTQVGFELLGVQRLSGSSRHALPFRR